MNRLWRLVSLVVLLGLVGVPAISTPAGAVVRPPGYVLAASDGGVFAFGRPFLGSAANLHLRAPIVGIAATPDGGGYWLVASDGGVFAFGNARFFGSTGGITLNQPIVGIAATPDGGGYWLVASDGGVFAFGNAGFFGSLSGAHILAPVVSIATTGDGGGYWLLTGGGEAFAFGDALAPGAPPAFQAANNTYVGIAPVAGTTRGFVLVTRTGARVFVANVTNCVRNWPVATINAPIVGITTTTTTCGHLLAASDGGVFAFGVPFLGSAARLPLTAPIVGIAN